jgi:hypothetical protein
MREHSNTSDPLRSPRLSWMGAFLWIYIPPLLVMATAAVRPLRTHVLRHRAAAAAMVLLMLQYVLQWLDQFVRDGNGLEISYYWSFIYPTMGVALAVTVGAVRWTPRGAGTFAAAWIGVLAITSQVRVVMPGGWWFPVLAAAVIAITAFLWRRSSSIGVGGALRVPAPHTGRGTSLRPECVPPLQRGSAVRADLLPPRLDGRRARRSAVARGGPRHAAVRRGPLLPGVRAGGDDHRDLRSPRDRPLASGRAPDRRSRRSRSQHWPQGRSDSWSCSDPSPWSTPQPSGWNRLGERLGDARRAARRRAGVCDRGADVR